MIRELHDKLMKGETTAAKLAEDYYGRIAAKDGEIGAYLLLTKDLALKEAERVDVLVKKGEAIDLLAGLPCAVKDNINLSGYRTTAASKILENYISPYDADVVRRLKESGAVMLGKTNMDEFACGSSTESSAYQKTKNPLDLSRVPGGSSGGSAAAVAGDLAVWALGSDTGGSIRQPASFCGVVGLKPTYGRVSRSGLLAMSSSLDQIGPITRSVEDAAIVLSRIAGREGLDATSAKSFEKPYEDYLNGAVKGYRIGIVRKYLEGLEGNIRQKFEAALDKFRGLGAEIVDIEMPHAEYGLATYYIIMPAELSSNLARFDGVKYGLQMNDRKDSGVASGDLPKNLLETYLDTRAAGFGSEIKRRIMLGTYTLSAGYYDAYYLKAQKVRALIRRDFEEAFRSIDFIFTPTAPEPAFKFGAKTDDPLKMYLSDIYTITANLAGVPAISFPIGTVPVDGTEMPIGGQLMGRWFDEENLLNLAHTFEINQAK